MLVNYDGYLTEKKLVSVCKSQLFPNFEVLVNRPLPESNFPKRYRYDILIPKLRLAIEFDGYRHFQDTPTILRDITKDSTARTLGWKVVRIPYFVQVTSKVVRLLFNLDTESKVDFPHGFVEKKALRPHSFSVLGWLRFRICLEDYSIVREEILSTLDNHSLLLYQNLNYENLESTLDDFSLKNLRPYTDFLHQK